MDKPVDHFWQLRLDRLKKSLEGNNFETHVVPDRQAAKALTLDVLIPGCNPRSLAWGGSMTYVATGLYDALKSRTDLEIIDTYDKNKSAEELLESRRQALLADLFIAGTNAVTEHGHLVNLDMIGNRVAALAFGPRWVIVLVGRNKIVPDLGEAIDRVKGYAAPTNVMRLDKKTPCAKTGRCHDCDSPERICNHWAITEKSFPPKRIKVVLINEDLGF